MVTYVSKATYRHFCSVEARLHYYITWQKASASPWIICFMLIQQKNTINVRDKDVKGGSSFIIWSWQDCTVSTSIFKTPPITSLLCSCVAHSSIIKSHHTHSALRTKREDHFLLSSFTPTSSLSWRITINKKKTQWQVAGMHRHGQGYWRWITHESHNKCCLSRNISPPAANAARLNKRFQLRWKKKKKGRMGINKAWIMKIVCWRLFFFFSFF